MTDEQFKQLMDKLDNLQRAIDAGRVVFAQPIPPQAQPWNPAWPYNPNQPWQRPGAVD